ncbi:Flp family type IVb pilin [Ferrimonas sp.]|uniref:Flp family type IVb pilin n=1 Tax=Ferrimonas sp. TaxID=2080861 RepID=UPI003A9044E7
MQESGISAFLKDENGLSTVEYAIAGSLVAAGMVVAFGELGIETAGRISEICSNLDAAGDCDGQ